MAFLEDLLRTITFFIDKLIYSFIPTVYNFIYELADRVIFSQAELETIARNIYAIIGIFMLFRLSFVLLISIVNPDNLTDKEKGFTKMISKIVIAIVMITAIPIGFDLAYQLQGAILKNAIVEKVILGNEISTSELTPEISCKYDISNSGTFQDYYIGEDINFIVLFFSEGSDKTIRPTIKYLNNTNTEINPDNYIYSSKELVKSKFLDLTGNISCLTNIRLALNTDDIEPYVEIRMFNGSGDHENMFLISEPAKKNNEKGGVLLARKAFKAFMNCNPNTDSCSNDEEGEVPAGGLNINQAISQGIPLKGTSNFGLISKSINQLQEVEGGSEYIINYTPLLSTITGGAILALLLVLCFDVATRVVKLAFFQIITPVAVIGYIEPGSKIFNQWLQMTIKTFVNLFIRLFAISFVVLILGAIGDKVSLGDLGDLFLIFGALIFAKEAPKLISDMFGIQDGGLGGMLRNPFKNMAGGGLLTKAGSFAGGLALGGAGKALAAGGGALAGGLNSKLRKGSFIAGASKGAKAASKDIKMTKGIKEATIGSTKAAFGAYRNASNAGASSALGKDVKTGLGAFVGKKYESFIDERETSAMEDYSEKLYKNKESGKQIYSQPYQAAIDDIKNRKKDLSTAKSQLSYWNARVATDGADAKSGHKYNKALMGSSKYAAKFTDGYELTNHDLAQMANENVGKSEKNLDIAKENKTKLMEKPNYASDVRKEKAIDEYEYSKLQNQAEIPEGQAPSGGPTPSGGP
ncbi:MAG: conjugal transfer protein TrbL family protein, partial [Bacilli bacterium]